MCSSVRAAAPSRASCSAALRDAGQSETNIVELGWALGRRMTGALNGTLTLGGVVDDGNYTDSGTQVCDSGESIMIRVLTGVLRLESPHCSCCVTAAVSV